MVGANINFTTSSRNTSGRTEDNHEATLLSIKLSCLQCGTENSWNM